MALPDPISTDIQHQSIPQMQSPPTISSDYKAVLRTNGILDDIDTYVRTGKSSSLVNHLLQCVTISQHLDNDNSTSQREALASYSPNYNILTSWDPNFYSYSRWVQARVFVNGIDAPNNIQSKNVSGLFTRIVDPALSRFRRPISGFDCYG